MKKQILVTALSLAGLLATPAWAESQFVSPASSTVGNTATAKLDFTITIPQVLFLRVGASTGNAATTATVDGITFTVPAANVGDATAITGVGGDLTADAVTVRVYGNGGSINLNSATSGPLTSPAGDTIPWSQINVTAAALTTPTGIGFTNGIITHPAFNTGATGGNGTVTSLTATSKVVRVEGRWTYSYLNANAVAAGTYGATTGTNGRVTYTATQL